MRPRACRLPLAAITAAAALSGAMGARAEDAAEATPEKPLGLSFVGVPIPVSNPALGGGLAVAGAALYTPFGSERPWITGGVGLYTSNKSWAAAFAQKAYIDRDRYRVTAGGGAGDFHVEFFGIGQEAGSRGISIPIDQKAAGALVEGLMRVFPHLYAGIEYRGVDMRTTLDLSQLLFPDLDIPQAQLRSKTSALGLAGEWDTRDSELQPKRGIYLTATWLKASQRLGGDFNYDRLELAANGYAQIDDRSLVAWRGFLCHAGREAPFYDICNFGQGADLRGYLAGQYRDRAMYAVQAEYRRRLFWRLGATAFAGFGEVAARFHDMNVKTLLPAAGVGLRLQASKRYDVNIRLDYAVGKGSDAVYVSVGEAF